MTLRTLVEIFRQRRSVQVTAALALAALLVFTLMPERTARLEIPFREYTLANGLRVILAEDHTAPTVSLAVTYRVGSRDEKPGRTGLAHLFEHLMFQGSQNVGKGEHSILIQNNGGSMNGTTNQDRTSYFQTLPANQLDLALFLEADRMKALDLSEANFENQRRSVQEERRQVVDNQPFGRTHEAVLETAYASFPYRHLPIGSMDDLRSATLEEAREFFRTYYAPANAVLTLVGDFQSDEALAKVRKHFEAIPAGAPLPSLDLTEPPQTEERRRTIGDPFAQAPRLDIAYKIPPAHTPDWYALRMLGTILGEGEPSRLYRRLVREGELAAFVAALTEERAGPSLFRLGVLLRPEKQPQQVEKILDEEIEKLREEPVAAEELQKAHLQVRRRLAQQFQSTLSRTILLGEAAALFQNANLVNEIERNDARITRGDLQRVARKYLKPENRTVILTVPAPQGAVSQPPPPLEESPDARGTPLSKVVRKGRVPVSKEILKVRALRPVEITLPNGLTALVIEDHRLPVVSVFMSVTGAGPLHDSPELPGLATFAAQMLREGTVSRTSRQIAEEVERTGATLNTSATAGSSAAVITASGLSENFEEWFALLADILQNPRFPSDELNSRRQRMLVQLRQQRAAPQFLANEQLARAVFGSHPAAVSAPAPETLERITSEMLARWHRERYAPQNTMIGIVGDVKVRKIRKNLEKWFGNWPKTDATDVLPPNPQGPAARQVFLVDRPGSVQTTLLVGNLGIDRRSPDYMTMVVLHRVLGGGPSARLFLNLREEKGYTYDAYSIFSALKYPGAWRASADVRAEVTEPALRELLAEIRRVTEESVPAEELEEAKRSVVASFALSLEQPAQVLNNWITKKVYGFSDDYWDTYPAKIMAVSAEEVQHVARRYLAPDRLQIVVVGDAARIRPRLAQFGPLEVIAATGRPAAVGARAARR